MESRTTNTIKNAVAALGGQFINIVIKLGVRLIFIKFLGQEYLGINGVFSNIITVLSLAEMGIGTAILYTMYKPAAERDTVKVNQLCRFYKKIYFLIGSMISVLGIIFIPFLKYIISDITNVGDITVIYLLFLLNTISSYFFAHYQAVLNANQLNRIITRYNTLLNVIKSMFEIGILIQFHNYILYLLIQIMCNFVSNLLIYREARRMFPYITKKNIPIASWEVKEILRHAFSMFSIKISTTVINATDNLVISTFVSTVSVGIYSNYSLVIQIILTTITLLMGALQGSVGNLCSCSDQNKKYAVFLNIQYGFSFLYCFSAACLYNLLTPFISLFFGNDYLLSNKIVIIIVLNFYLIGTKQPFEIFINSDGLFRYFKKKCLVEAAINLCVSIFLAKYMGMAGVFLGTIVSYLFTSFWYDPYIVYREEFSGKLSLYFVRFIWQFVILLICMAIPKIICRWADLSGVLGFVLLLIISAGTSIILFGVLTYRSQEFAYIKNLFWNILNRN